MLQKILSTMLAVFFLGFAGFTVAASDTGQVVAGVDSGTTQQSPAPAPDCKKDPSDPRCKGR